MGLAADLGYAYSPPNALQRTMQAFGSTKPGAWFFSKTLRHFDRVIHKVSKGRTSMPAVLAGLIAPPVADTVALLGTNFGQASTPAWVLNLEADPHATVEYHNTTKAVVARPATDAERDEIWQVADGVYGGYAKYQQRITGRQIRLFVLEPDPGPDPVATD